LRLHAKPAFILPQMHLIRFNPGLWQQHNAERPLQSDRSAKPFRGECRQPAALPFPGNQARPDPRRRQGDPGKKKC
jgi:hypothetical protein